MRSSEWEFVAQVLGDGRSRHQILAWKNLLVLQDLSHYCWSFDVPWAAPDMCEKVYRDIVFAQFVM
jgi:hypothetical protein